MNQEPTSLTLDESTKRLTTPCGSCPWRRTTTPGQLGGSSPVTYLGQVNGAFWLPCHSFTDYNDPKWRDNTAKPQCAGAATFRTNIQWQGFGTSAAKILHTLPANTEIVFASNEEFLAHHVSIPVTFARLFIKQAGGVGRFVQYELQRQSEHRRMYKPAP
jgi:hypothetical protein